MLQIEGYDVIKSGFDLIKRVKPALRSDDGVSFKACVRRCVEIERVFHLFRGTTFSKHKLLALICTHRAENCARVLVLGLAGIYVDNLNLPLKDAGLGLPPLHLAAQNLSLGVTEAFLMAGADPNLCCFHDHHQDDDDDDDHDDDDDDHDDDDDDHDDGDDDHDDDHDIANLPLSFALEALSCNRCVTDWSVEKSVMKLIYILCLQELREPLETIRILASRTKHLEKLSLRYAEKGQVVQLTALLLVAWNKLVTPSLELLQGGVERCAIGECILKELQSLSCSNQQSTTTAQFPSSDLLVKLQSAWKMLKLLESKYHKIDEFLIDRPFEGVENHEVPFVVSAFTMMEGGPEDLNCEDIPCLMPRLNPKQKVWLDRALRTYSGPPAVYAFNSRKGFAETTLLSKSFHTCSNSNFKNDKGRLTLITKVEKPAFRQLLPTARTCAYLVSMAKRGLK